MTTEPFHFKLLFGQHTPLGYPLDRNTPTPLLQNATHIALIGLTTQHNHTPHTLLLSEENPHHHAPIPPQTPTIQFHYTPPYPPKLSTPQRFVITLEFSQPFYGALRLKTPLYASHVIAGKQLNVFPPLLPYRFTEQAELQLEKLYTGALHTSLRNILTQGTLTFAFITPDTLSHWEEFAHVTDFATKPFFLGAVEHNQYVWRCVKGHMTPLIQEETNRWSTTLTLQTIPL